jgi:20S proteasome subunit alpha 7
MTAIGTGYDLSCQTYSPDGRVFQVEYAGKAVENSGTAIGLRVKDGVVLGVEKLIISKMLVEGSNRRIFHVDKHIGLAAAGMSADSRQLVNRARSDARGYKDFYGDAIPARILNDRVSLFVQSYTLYGHMRPFGSSVLLASIDKTGPQLYMIEPSGLSYGYLGVAIGKGRLAAKTEIEKLKLSQMTCREAVDAIAKIILAVHDDVKDKECELELSWICEASGNVHQHVPKELRDRAERLARAALKAEMED